MLWQKETELSAFQKANRCFSTRRLLPPLRGPPPSRREALIVLGWLGFGGGLWPGFGRSKPLPYRKIDHRAFGLRPMRILRLYRRGRYHLPAAFLWGDTPHQPPKQLTPAVGERLAPPANRHTCLQWLPPRGGRFVTAKGLLPNGRPFIRSVVRRCNRCLCFDAWRGKGRCLPV